MKRYWYGGVLILLVIAAGCKRGSMGNVEPGNGQLKVSISHSVDGQPLLWDSLMYTNAAGNTYSVSKLHYYISDIRFYRSGIEIQRFDSVYYVDAAKSATCSFTLSSWPGSYDSMSFYIGLQPERNISYSLQPTIENTDMAWPDAMGGGYHFLKLEGHWKDNTGSVVGFAMHLGQNGFQCATGVASQFNISSQAQTDVRLSMNINEWFRNPNTYDLEKDGVYTMGNMMLMKKVSENGKDVFSVY